MLLKNLVAASLALCSAACMAPQALNAQQTMNNDAVIKLVAVLALGILLQLSASSVVPVPKS
jgi:hypothetical protein